MRIRDCREGGVNRLRVPDGEAGQGYSVPLFCQMAACNFQIGGCAWHRMKMVKPLNLVNQEKRMKSVRLRNFVKQIRWMRKYDLSHKEVLKSRLRLIFPDRLSDKNGQFLAAASFPDYRKLQRQRWEAYDKVCEETDKKVYSDSWILPIGLICNRLIFLGLQCFINNMRIAGKW